MSSGFDVSKNNGVTMNCKGYVNTISIDHVDIDSDNYGSLKLHYVDGTSTLIKFKGNGGLTFLYNNQETNKLTKGIWNLQNILRLPVFFTAFCSNTYIKNTWEFCTTNLSSVEFFTNTLWSGMNSVKIIRSVTIPLYFRGLVTSMQEHNEKIVISASEINEGLYLKERLENYHKNRFHEYTQVLDINVLFYPETDKVVFKCKDGINQLMRMICGSKNFFIDENGFICCKTWYDVSLMNKFLGTNLPLEKTPVPINLQPTVTYEEMLVTLEEMRVESLQNLQN